MKRFNKMIEKKMAKTKGGLVANVCTNAFGQQVECKGKF